MVKIIFLRHGKTQGNLEGRYIGTTDEDLCESGILTLKQAIEKNNYKCFEDCTVQRVFSSPLMRCKQTAGLIYPNLSPIIIDEFRETDFGLFENKNYEELNGRKDYQDWIDSKGSLPFPEGESRTDIEKRVKAALIKMMKICEEEKITCVACVIHGGILMSLMDSYAVPKREYFDWQVKNGCGFAAEVEKEKNDYRIRVINRISA